MFLHCTQQHMMAYNHFLLTFCVTCRNALPSTIKKSSIYSLSPKCIKFIFDFIAHTCVCREVVNLLVALTHNAIQQCKIEIH